MTKKKSSYNPNRDWWPQEALSFVTRKKAGYGFNYWCPRNVPEDYLERVEAGKDMAVEFIRFEHSQEIKNELFMGYLGSIVGDMVERGKIEGEDGLITGFMHIINECYRSFSLGIPGHADMIQRNLLEDRRLDAEATEKEATQRKERASHRAKKAWAKRRNKAKKRKAVR